MVQTAVALAMSNLKKKPRWQAAPTPTGDYGEQRLDGVLYAPEDNLPPILIGACIEQYREEFSHRRPSTAYHVAEAINHLLLSLGMHENLPMAAITRDQLIRYKTMLMRRLLGHSIGNDVESRVYLGSLTYGVKELSEALEKVTFPPIM
jgi:hypothetical protein